jgi:hypothetical protein
MSIVRKLMKKNSKQKTQKLTQELDASIDEIKSLLKRKKRPMKPLIKKTRVDDALLDLLRKTGF